MTDLATLRSTIGRAILVLLWFHVPAIALIALVVGNGWLWPTVLAAGVAAIASAGAAMSPDTPSTRLTMGVALIAMVSLIVAACGGTPWQFEAHMYYFAALAMLAAYCDATVILTAAAVTAVHHLCLNFLATDLVFPGGADIKRVILHAVIVLMEAGTLTWMTHHVVRLFAISDANMAAAEAASQAAEASRAEAAAQRRLAEEEHREREAQKAEAAVQSFVVAEMAAGLKRLAAGDLTPHLSQTFAADYEVLRGNFNGAVAQLHQLVHSLVNAIAEIESQTGDITAANDDLGRRTEQQAASLAETASALDAITATIGRTAEGAMKVRDVVARTHVEAAKSDTVVSRAVSAMGGISDSSQRISQIVGVIDEIAFQTNLLALNAGVEAARAGESGRGFAVVASEVRALAQRSAAAAKEIKVLISASTAQVDDGVRLVGETGRALQAIMAQVGEVSGVVTEIAASAQQQAAGLTQINVTMNDIDQLTQKNATMAGESIAASHALAHAISGLVDLTAQFRIAAPRAVAQVEPRRATGGRRAY